MQRRRQTSLLARTDNVAPKYYCRDSDSRVMAQLSAFAARTDINHATFSYAWLPHNGVTAPIVGAPKSPHMDDAVAAIDMSLSAEDIAELEAPFESHSGIGHR